jgi:hypothetical protein
MRRIANQSRSAARATKFIAVMIVDVFRASY